MGLSRETFGAPVRYVMGAIAGPKPTPPEIAQVAQWVTSEKRVPDESLTPDSAIGEVKQLQGRDGKTIAVFDFRREGPQSSEAA